MSTAYRNANIYRAPGLRYDGLPTAQLSIRARIKGPTPLTYDDIGFIYDNPNTTYDNLPHTVQLLSIGARLLGPRPLTYDDIGFIYDNPLTPYDSGTAVTTVATFTAKARIRVLSTATLSMGSSIQNNLTVFTMKSRVSQRQGYPIPASYDPQIAVFTATQQTMRGSLLGLSLGIKTIGLRGRINPAKTTTFTFKAHLVSGQSFSMKANVTPWRTYVHLPCSFTVQSVAKKYLRMVFYTGGVYSVPQFTSQARIIKVAKKRFTAHFIVPMPAVTGVLTNSNSMNYKQVMGIKAFIVGR